jgi:MFS transporter, CP family, cyanate transporter
VSPRQRVLVIALALTGFTMRTAVTSVGAALDEIENGLHTSSGIAGVLTTLPVVCFAGIGAATPRFSSRYGPHRLLVAALAIAAVGTALRAVAGSIWVFLLFSVLALTGGAVANVLLPSLVKLHFPDRIGPMTAVYSTALAVGTTAAAGLTVPIGDLGSGWRMGIGSWALFSVVAILPWLPTIAREIRPAEPPARLSARALVHSRTAWILMAFFAAQSTTAYMAFGWMARFMHAHGVSEETAGWMVAVMSAVGIPVSIVVPLVAPRRHRMVVLGLGACFLVAYLGLGLAPVSGAWLWMILYGIGNGMFPLALTMIGLRTRTPETTAAVSAFVQALGYIVAGTGPLLFGVLYGATGSWVLPLSLLWISLVCSVVTGWFASSPRYVDDELPHDQPMVMASSRSRRNSADTTGS